MRIKLIEVPEVPKSILVPKELYNKIDKLDYIVDYKALKCYTGDKSICIYFNKDISPGFYLRPTKDAIYVPIDATEWYDRDSNSIIMPNIFKSINNDYRFIINSQSYSLCNLGGNNYTCNYYNNEELVFTNEDRGIEIAISVNAHVLKVSKSGMPNQHFISHSLDYILDQFLNDEHTFELTI